MLIFNSNTTHLLLRASLGCSVAAGPSEASSSVLGGPPPALRICRLVTGTGKSKGGVRPREDWDGLNHTNKKDDFAAAGFTRFGPPDVKGSAIEEAMVQPYPSIHPSIQSVVSLRWWCRVFVQLCWLCFSARKFHIVLCVGEGQTLTR
ncbi:hypothetical protein V5799_017823 [Amblyomma americanum]|uniref:Secreted protein n=1 Tax=Amblyomma americanum TaxID=6943 RepID=A0AAQ4F235_AMBAM